MNKKKKEELVEGGLMDCMPMSKGNSLRKAVTKALLALFEQVIVTVTKPTQYGIGEKAGGSQLVFDTQLLVEINPHFAIIRLLN